MAWNVTLNGNTYTDAMFSGFAYVENFPRLIQDIAIVASAIQAKTITRSGPPTVADIPDGYSRVVTDTTAGRSGIWTNVGGTLVDLTSV